MSQPEEIAKADPLDADPSLAGAPLNVRKASAWLAAEARKPYAWARKLLAALPIASLLTGSIAASVAGDLYHSDTSAGLFFAAGILGALVSLIYLLREHRPTMYAERLVLRYRQLQEIGPPAELVPDETGSSPIDRMVARIESLAGDDRGAVRDAAVQARDHARRLKSELAHLAKISTGQPDADAALDGARSSLEADLARTQARVAELYASLVDLQAGGPADELRLATERISAELEVDAKLAAARRGAAVKQPK